MEVRCLKGYVLNLESGLLPVSGYGIWDSLRNGWLSLNGVIPAAFSMEYAVCLAAELRVMEDASDYQVVK